MSILVWDETGTRKYQTGIDHVAIRLDQSGAKWQAWNGATAVNENPSGADSTKLYADNVEYLNLISKEEFGASIECYDTPDNFAEVNGEKIFQLKNGANRYARVHFTAQARKPFEMMYRTLIGNDVNPAGSLDHAYIYHFVYNCKASVASKSHTTVNDSPEAASLSYDLTTTAKKFTVSGTDYYTAHFEVDCSKMTSSGDSSNPLQWERFKAYVENDENPIITPSTLLTVINP